jgi:hypothetical protein
MSLDDVLIAITLGGMLLAAAYIIVGFGESLRLQSLELRRRELAGDLQRAMGQENSSDRILTPEQSHRGEFESSDAGK